MTGADPANEIQGFTVEPGPVTLFCFSAATWNPHRIHYDADYARGTEGYPDIVVPGPLQGAWMLELADSWASRSGLEVEEIEYRNVKPAFANRALRVAGRVATEESRVTLEVWVAKGDERLCVGVVHARPVEAPDRASRQGTGEPTRNG